jgi:signal transduction histidine kinase/CheY-like chemotaxis protein
MSWAPVITAFIAFGVDIVTPRAIIDFYFVPILLCLRARSPRTPIYVAALCAPMMMTGYALSPKMGFPAAVTVSNQLFMLIVVWGGALMIASMLRATAAAKEAKQELERADRRKDEFLAILSHELRNPLAPIRTAADILTTSGVTPEQVRWASGMIRRQCARMSGLLDDLLEVARIAEGKSTLSLQLVSLASIVEAAIEMARPALDRKRHRLNVSLPTEPAMVRADPLRLPQVFSNLLTNAAKYTDPGGRIELAATIQDSVLSVSVKDNGIGIPSEALTRVFGLFLQMEGGNARAEGGMGIGLALAKGIVELHGGTIEARSQGRGHGSEFVTRLPLCARQPAVSSPTKSQATVMNIDNRRVLIADDNKDAADSLATLLALAGHEISVAYDGAAALSLARDFHPELALLDLDMPGLDGYAVAKALRVEPWAAQLSIVAITGWGDPENTSRAQAAGFDTHLIKPVEPDQVKALLRDQNKAVRRVQPLRPRIPIPHETEPAHPDRPQTAGVGEGPIATPSTRSHD